MDQPVSLVDQGEERGASFLSVVILLEFPTQTSINITRRLVTCGGHKTRDFGIQPRLRLRRTGLCPISLEMSTFSGMIRKYIFKFDNVNVSKLERKLGRCIHAALKQRYTQISSLIFQFSYNNS